MQFRHLFVTLPFALCICKYLSAAIPQSDTKLLAFRAQTLMISAGLFYFFDDGVLPYRAVVDIM